MDTDKLDHPWKYEPNLGHAHLDTNNQLVPQRS